MWGDCNIGAHEFYEEGSLYTWKEIMPKIDRCSAISGPAAIPDSMTCDLAEKMYGSGWQIPTKEHIIELMQKCEFEFVHVGRTMLLKATGPNRNYIYLPLVGNKDWNGNKIQGGFYWTSTKAVEENNSAYQLRISDQLIWGYNHIDVCQSVRPVYHPKNNLKMNYNKVDNPIIYERANLDYIVTQIENWCKKLNIPFNLLGIQEAERNSINKIPMAYFSQVLQLKKGNVLGHGNVTFIFARGQKLVALLIEKASKEYIDSVKNCGMVYGVIYDSITFGADIRPDSVVKLNSDEIYVRLY